MDRIRAIISLALLFKTSERSEIVNNESTQCKGHIQGVSCLKNLVRAMFEKCWAMFGIALHTARLFKVLKFSRLSQIGPRDMSLEF